MLKIYDGVEVCILRPIDTFKITGLSLPTASVSHPFDLINVI